MKLSSSFLFTLVVATANAQPYTGMCCSFFQAGTHGERFLQLHGNGHGNKGRRLDVLDDDLYCEESCAYCGTSVSDTCATCVANCLDPCPGQHCVVEGVAGCCWNGEGVGPTPYPQTCTDNEVYCQEPEDGGWSDWLQWGSCSAGCDGGFQTRERYCSNPPPSFGGADCEGESSQTRECNTQPCDDEEEPPIDGGWSDPVPNGPCSRACGGGTQPTIRYCNSPEPANGGADCVGDAEGTQECNTEDCPTLCPSAQPNTGIPCNPPGLECGYGEEVCCGQVYDAVAAICSDSGWEIVPTDACLGGCSADVDMDPHFRDWHGQFWDFHGICDMMFLFSKKFGNGKGLRIHIRTKGRYNYSYIESAVVMIAEDVLEVSSFGGYTVNGISNVALDDVQFGGDYKIEYKNPSTNKHSFTIPLNKNESLVLTAWKDMVGVHVRGASFENFGDSVGLMGNYTTAMKLGRDGMAMAKEDPIVFGQEWQVLDTEPKLFQTIRDPQHPMQCIIPATIKAEGRKLGEGSISKEQAEDACAHWGDTYKALCVMDVLATQDLEAAEVGPGAF